MTGLWWWQNYQKSNEERDNLVQTYVEKEKTAEVPVTHSNEIPVTVNTQPAVSSNETTSVVEKTNNAAEPAVSTTQENQAQPVNAEVSTAELQHLLLDKLKHLLWNKRYLTQNQQQSKLCQIHKVRLKTPLFLKHQLQRKAISLLRSRKIQAGLV